MQLLNSILKTQSVSLAAQEHFLTQSAASHALKKLRAQFNDELIVLVGGKSHLTEKGELLKGLLSRVIDELETGLSAIENPDVEWQEVRIGIEDYCEYRFCNDILAALRAAFANIKVRFVHFPDEEIEEALYTKKIHFAIGVSNPNSSNIKKKRLLTDRLVTAMGVNHPIVREGLGLTVENYVKYPHANISTPDSGLSDVDIALSELGKNREVIFSAAYFLSAPEILKTDNLLLTGSELLLTRLKLQHDIKLFQPPIKLPTYDISLFWHIKDDQTAALQKIRNILYSVVKIPANETR
ncbi:MAG: LysR family transcriptional regulator [Aestuariibacter sp.]